MLRGIILVITKLVVEATEIELFGTMPFEMLSSLLRSLLSLLLGGKFQLSFLAQTAILRMLFFLIGREVVVLLWM